jgi:hypothetical protein
MVGLVCYLLACLLACLAVVVVVVVVVAALLCFSWLSLQLFFLSRLFENLEGLLISAYKFKKSRLRFAHS